MYNQHWTMNDQHIQQPAPSDKNAQVAHFHPTGKHNPGCSQPVGYQENGAPTNDFRNPGNSQVPQTPRMILHTPNNVERMSSTQSRRFQTLSAENMVLGTSRTPTMASGTPAAPRIPSQHVTSNTPNRVQIPSTQNMPYMVTRTPQVHQKSPQGHQLCQEFHRNM